MKKKKDRYVVWIYVKPYVRKYLLQNFRVFDSRWKELVNLSSDRELSTYVDISLKKPSHRYDNRVEGKMKRCRIALEISKDSFYRYGWALSPTDENRLNKLLEYRCQVIAKTFLSTQYMWTGNLADAIRLMYRTYGWTSEDWDEDTIRKMWFRDKNLPKISVCDEIFKKKTRFLLEQMSNLGTITLQGKKEYENNLLQL